MKAGIAPPVRAAAPSAGVDHPATALAAGMRMCGGGRFDVLRLEFAQARTVPTPSFRGERGEAAYRAHMAAWAAPLAAACGILRLVLLRIAFDRDATEDTRGSAGGDPVGALAALERRALAIAAEEREGRGADILADVVRFGLAEGRWTYWRPVGHARTVLREDADAAAAFAAAIGPWGHGVADIEVRLAARDGSALERLAARRAVDEAGGGR